MRKRNLLFLVIAMCISLCACGTEEKAEEVTVEVEEDVEEESSVENEEVETEDSEIEVIELTSNEKFNIAKIFMKDGDLDGALSILKEIETEMPKASDLIALCEKYIPYCGIWTTENFVRSTPKKTDEPKEHKIFVEIFIDYDTSIITANVNDMELWEEISEYGILYDTSEIVNSAYVSYQPMIMGLTVDELYAELNYVHEDGTPILFTFDFATGDYSFVLEGSKGKTTEKGSFEKRETNIYEYGKFNYLLEKFLIGATGNPRELIDDCWLADFEYDGAKKIRTYFYRLSNSDKQLAKEKYDKYIEKILPQIGQEYQYEVYKNGSIDIWDLRQNKSEDSAYIKIYMEESRVNFLAIEIHEEIEISENNPKEPQIGMTKSELKQSTWGIPNDINTSEYSWGTEEQWVYDGKGYVYLENGVVTAVQHR